MAVRREVVSLSQLLQRRNSARAADPLAPRSSAGGRRDVSKAPLPLARVAASKQLTPRVVSGYEPHALSQQEGSSYPSQSANSALSLSQDVTEEDSCMSLSQVAYSQPRFSQSQEEARVVPEQVSSPTTSQGKYLQRFRRDFGRPSRQFDEREMDHDALEQALRPIQSTLDDINSAIQQQQTDRNPQTVDSSETKQQLTDLVSAVDTLREQHHQHDSITAEQHQTQATETAKVSTTLEGMQVSLGKMDGRTESMSDLLSQFMTEQRAGNQAVLDILTKLRECETSLQENQTPANRSPDPSPQSTKAKPRRRSEMTTPVQSRTQRKQRRYELPTSGLRGRTRASPPTRARATHVYSESDEDEEEGFNARTYRFENTSPESLSTVLKRLRRVREHRHRHRRRRL